MIIKLKLGDDFIEVDDNFPLDEVNTLNKREDSDLEDTIEIFSGEEDSDE